MTKKRRPCSAKEIKYFLLNRVLTSAIVFVLRIYAKTLRVRIEGKEEILKHLAGGGRVIFASWHQRLFGGFFVPRFFQWTPCIMISQSRRRLHFQNRLPPRLDSGSGLQHPGRRESIESHAADGGWGK